MPRKMWIANTWTDASGGATREVVNPTDGSVLARVPEATADDVRKAIAAARAAFDDGPWPRLPGRDRGTVLFRIAEAIRARAAEFAETRYEEHGQAHRRSRVRRQRCGALLRVLRRAGVENPRRDARGSRQRALDGRARACRRRRSDHPVELPASDGRVEAGAGIGSRVYGRLEAGRADAALCTRPR